MIPRRARGPALAAIALVLGAGGAAAADGGGPILTSRGLAHPFAADGNWVATSWGTPTPRICDAARAVHVVTGRVRAIASPRSICEDEWAVTGSLEIAVAGDRVAWISYGLTNNSAAHVLSTARIDSPKGRMVARGDGDTASGDNVEFEDRRVGLLSGDGGTMAYATWTIRPGGVAVRDEQVWRIGPTGAPLRVGAMPGLRAVAVEHGTIAVLRRGGLVTMISTRTGARRTLVLQGLASKLQQRRDFDLGLSAGRLVVLASRSLEVFDASSGASVRSWSLPAGEPRERGLVDVHGDWISFLVRNRIHLHRISDGAAGVVPPQRLQPRGCDGDVWAQVEKLGLVYSSSRTDAAACGTSRIATIGFEELAAYVRGGAA